MKNSSVYMEKPPENPEDLQAAIHSLDTQSKLAEAAELARDGAYGAAEELVKTIRDWESFAPALDLMARVNAQQGRLDTASKYWASAIQLSPTNRSYQAGLEYVTRLKRPMSNAGKVLRWLLNGMGVLLIGIILVLAFQQLTRTEPPATAPASEGQIATLQAQLISLYNTPTAAPTLAPTETLMPSPTSTPETSELQEMSVNVDGFKTTFIEEAWIVYPVDNMFDYTWRLTSDTRAQIAELGRQLEPFSGKIAITLVGSKQLSEESEYFDVGLTRSSIVFRELQNSTQLPPDIFVIMPMESFLRQPYAEVLKAIDHIDKYVLFLIYEDK